MILALLLLTAAETGPPPYETAVRCAGVSMAWSDLRAGEQPARDEAEIWAFATMDAARRAGRTAPEAEEAMARETFLAKARFKRGDDGAAGDLDACRKLLPKPAE